MVRNKDTAKKAKAVLTIADAIPCPFCGCLRLLRMSMLLHVHQVNCYSCMAYGPAGRTEHEALKLWNTWRVEFESPREAEEPSNA